MALAGFFGHRALARRHEAVVLAALGRRFLIHEAELPSPGSWRAIEGMTVPGSPARLAAKTAASPQAALQPLVHVVLKSVRVRLGDVQITQSDPLTLHAQVIIQRQFSPAGYNQLDANGTFQFTGASTPRLLAVQLTTNRSMPTGGPDAFNLNLWNLVPAGPLPHGS